MLNPLRLVVLLVSFFTVVLASTHSALAAPITYTITGRGNITFGGGRTGDTPFTIRATGDTSNIAGNSIRTLENIVAKVQVSGFPEATFTNADSNFLQVNNSTSLLTFSGSRLTTIELSHQTFSNYNLATNRGPVFFAGLLSNTSLISQQPTTAGPITIAGFRDVTFTAAVPEPAGVASLMIAIGLLFARRRQIVSRCGNQSLSARCRTSGRTD